MFGLAARAAITQVCPALTGLCRSTIATAQKGVRLSSAIDFSAGQLAAARATAWHQDGKALETLDSARAWVDHYGLVLFAPRAQQLGAPAPSFIEATLGAANEAPTVAQSATARSLAARLVAEGSALPLTLLGSAGDTPDFLASAKVFSYVFTMRGDKAWKQPPSSIEGAKVSPLAVRVWEVLGEKGALTAAELVSELGREVTKAAIMRALNELWSQLRVLPQHQQDDAPALWELTSKRFAKAIKAGTNAGQPTAMSALLSLYLSQAVAATEEEVAGFLSPLTARSRIRDVVHALIAGRQLETAVVEGRTLLHVSGTLPEFPAIAKPEGEAAEPETPKAPKVGTGRIARFTGGADKPRSDFKGKPAFGSATRERSTGPRGVRPGGPRPSRPVGAKPDSERRPFKRADDSKPTFTKPWDEDKRPRRAPASETPEPRERKSYGDKPAYGPKKTFGERKTFGDKPAYGSKKTFGERKNFGDKPSPRPSFGDRPARPARAASSEGFTPRERPAYPKRETGARSYERKPFAKREGGDDRPRRSFDKPRSDKPGGFDKPRTYAAKSGGFSKFSKPDSDRKLFRKREDGERSGGPRSASRPSFNRPSRPRSEGDSRPSSDRPRSFGSKSSYGAKPSLSSRPAFGSKPRFGASARPAFGAGKLSGSGARPASKSGKFGAKPSGKFGAKPARPYARKIDGAAPTRRKRDAEE